jgi:hypothetical protein
MASFRLAGRATPWNSRTKHSSNKFWVRRSPNDLIMLH